jgi:hypothetical protein
MTQTRDPRSPWLYNRISRSDRSGSLSCSPPPYTLQFPYPDLPSLRTLSRPAQRARVGDLSRPLKPSKPSKLWQNHVRLLAEQRLAEDEAEELGTELGLAMRDGDLESITLLTRQMDELANGIYKMSVSKSKSPKKEQGDEEVRTGDSVLDFVRMLRSMEEEEEW